MLWNRKGLACETKTYQPRCPICDQVAHCLFSLCLCASQNVPSFGRSLSLNLSHLLSGEPLCVTVLFVHSWCLCLHKNKTSNPFDNSLFIRLPTVCMTVQFVHSLVFVQVNVPSFGNSLSGGPIFCQVAPCLCGYMSCV